MSKKESNPPPRPASHNPDNMVCSKKEYSELKNARYSARYILEDLQHEEGMEAIAEVTGLPMGVIVSAFENIFKGWVDDEEQFERFKEKVEKEKARKRKMDDE